MASKRITPRVSGKPRMDKKSKEESMKMSIAKEDPTEVAKNHGDLPNLWLATMWAHTIWESSYITWKMREFIEVFCILSKEIHCNMADVVYLWQELPTYHYMYT